MPSPFPGMDPYLEDPAFWSDFHATFINYCREALLDCLPDNYEARIDEKVRLVEVAPAGRKRIEPDVAATRHEPSSPPMPAPAGVATLEPVTIPLIIEEEETHERYIEILHRPERTLVAVLELLSPANKEERALPPGDYYALVSPGDRRPNCDVYSWTVRQRLPAIPIPLLPPDPDVWLDLAAVFATTYERGRYARSLVYASPPPVSLDDGTRHWVMERARGSNGQT